MDLHQVRDARPAGIVLRLAHQCGVQLEADAPGAVESGRRDDDPPIAGAQVIDHICPSDLGELKDPFHDVLGGHHVRGERSPRGLHGLGARFPSARPRAPADREERQDCQAGTGLPPRPSQSPHARPPPPASPPAVLSKRGDSRLLKHLYFARLLTHDYPTPGPWLTSPSDHPSISP